MLFLPITEASTISILGEGGGGDTNQKFSWTSSLKMVAVNKGQHSLSFFGNVESFSTSKETMSQMASFCFIPLSKATVCTQKQVRTWYPVVNDLPADMQKSFSH